MDKGVVRCYNKDCEDWSDDLSLMESPNFCCLYLDILKSECGKEILINPNKGDAMKNDPCTNTNCNHYSPTRSDGSYCSQWKPRPAIEFAKKCSSYQPSKGAAIMLTKAKSIATSIHSTIKPYEKYIGLIALAVVIDHFLLDGKFAYKFRELAEVIVTKIQSGLDKMTERLTGEWFTETTDGKEDN